MCDAGCSSCAALLSVALGAAGCIAMVISHLISGNGTACTQLLRCYLFAYLSAYFGSGREPLQGPEAESRVGALGVGCTSRFSPAES